MEKRWSPHPRYRLYTGMDSYRTLIGRFPCFCDDSSDSLALLEGSVCRKFKVGSACCVPMARIGLFFGLQELIKPGQRVILSPLTIVDIVNMVILAGGIPVFADIHRQSCAIDPDQAESLIDNKTGAVLITHLHGESAGAHKFLEICRRHGIPLIEDAAQAFGAIEHGLRLGTIGDLGVYSFGFYKNLNAWRGGMLVSQNQDLIARIKRRMIGLPAFPTHRLMATASRGLLTDLATWPPLFSSLTHKVIRWSFLRGITFVNHQLDPEHNASRLSEIPPEYSGQMTSPQASIALKQLERVDEDTMSRIANAAQYHQALAPLEMLIKPKWDDSFSNIYTYYPIQFREREALLRYAMLSKRDFAAQHLRNCADLPEFHEFYRDCPNARASARELILLPTYPRYPATEIQRNIESIQQFLASAISHEDVGHLGCFDPRWPATFARIALQASSAKSDEL